MHNSGKYNFYVRKEMEIMRKIILLGAMTLMLVLFPSLNLQANSDIYTIKESNLYAGELNNSGSNGSLELKLASNYDKPEVIVELIDKSGAKEPVVLALNESNEYSIIGELPEGSYTIKENSIKENGNSLDCSMKDVDFDIHKGEVTTVLLNVNKNTIHNDVSEVITEEVDMFTTTQIIVACSVAGIVVIGIIVIIVVIGKKSKQKKAV